MKAFAVAVTLLSSLAIAAVLAASGAWAHAPEGVIVQWDAGTSPSERRAAREDADVEFDRDLGDRSFQLVETKPGQSPGQAVRELEADPSVILAERDAYLGVDALPDDPLFDQLWGLRNTGLGVGGFAGALAGADIEAGAAWDRTVGTPSTLVAVIDSGYRFEHPDLKDVVWTNPDEIPGNDLDDDFNGIVDDVHGADFVGADVEMPVIDGDPTDDNLVSGGHGVHVAGTVGAEGDNGVGVTGVAQDVSIMPLRVCSRLDWDLECLLSAAVTAVNYAGAKGARVANMSFGSTEFTAALGNAIAANPQTLFVVSAGNEAASNDQIPRHPCTVDPVGEGKGTVDNVICVAATDQADGFAFFSNRGAKTVDLGAPGTQTLSTDTRHNPIEEDFEVDDFASKWIAGGPDGGFGRTGEAPLTSFGMSDSPDATPAPGSVREARTVPITVQEGTNGCIFEFDRWHSPNGDSYIHELYLDGVQQWELPGAPTGHQEIGMGDALSEGGEVEFRFRYTAGANPQPGDGVWIDNLELACRAPLGKADGYSFRGGTSMAAPHVTGTAALLFSLRPGASVTQVREGLLGSVERIPALAGKTATGGRLDAAAAVDLFDTVAPPAPTLSATNPASPADSNQPRLLGSAQRGTTVEVFGNANCSGAPVASGTAAQLAAPGFTVTVGDDTVTEFSARATDLAQLTSACSLPISYTQEEPAPDPGGGGDPDPGGGGQPNPGGGNTDPGGGGSTDSGSGDSGPTVPESPVMSPPPLSACVVPKLTGKTLAQAKRALTAAGCKLGTVGKPRARPGKRQSPLVVKSSTPGAGAKPAAGKVSLTLGPKPRKPGR